MNIETLVLGQLENNCFVITPDEASGDCVVVDTGLCSEPLLEYLKDNKLVPKALLLTHGHADHIAGTNLLRQVYPDMPVAIHKFDSDMLSDPEANLSFLVGINFTTPPAEIIIDSQTSIEFAGVSFKILNTPGHTPGGISFYNEKDKVVFSGDALFADGVGRTDFPGGDHSRLVSSIKDELFSLPPDTKVYSGHGPVTTIETEMKYNQFLK